MSLASKPVYVYETGSSMEVEGTHGLWKWRKMVGLFRARLTSTYYNVLFFSRECNHRRWIGMAPWVTISVNAKQVVNSTSMIGAGSVDRFEPPFNKQYTLTH